MKEPSGNGSGAGTGAEGAAGGERQPGLGSSEHYLQAVIDSIFAFVGVTTPDGTLTEANRAALEAAGLRPEEVLGRPFEETYWWSYDREVQRQLRAAIERAARGESSRYDVVIRLGPDSFAPIDFMLAPVRDEQGRVTHLVPSGTMIRDRIEAERALRESEERFRTLADNIPQLAWMADETGWIFWYNRRWYDYTGTTLEGMQGWGWRAVHHPHWVEGVTERFRAAIQAGEAWEDTFPLRGADGEYRWFLSRALPIRGEEGRVAGWFGTNTDITEQRNAAAERERLLREAEAASRAKSDFMAVMSHELRTPLNAILGYTDLLEAGVLAPLPAEARAYVERIRLSAEHQKQLIEDVLTFSRVDAGREALEVQPVSVETLLREIRAVIDPLAGRKALTVHTDTRRAPETIRTDGRKLRQILVNLLGNAVKFTERGQVALLVEQREPCVRFVVRDTGIGIRTEEQDRLFEPFWQADRSLTRAAEGTGLGLSISRRFAHMLGGDIRVESEPGQGSTFTLVLPLDPEQAGAERCWEQLAQERHEQQDRRSGDDRRTRD